METTIKNVLNVTATITSSGQPTIKQFVQIAEQGYQVIINLAMPDSSTAIQEEGAIVACLGMTYIHIPVPFDAPDQKYLQQFFNIMKVFSAHKVWVHCALNYRASAFLYLYLRIVEQQSAKQASSALLPSWEPNEIWSEFLKKAEMDSLVKQ